MKEVQAYTHLLYSLSGKINKLKMKDIRMDSGVKLNTAAMSIINVIDRDPGMSVTDLSKRMNLTKSAVSQMLKKLCALGLLEKGKNLLKSGRVCPMIIMRLYSASHFEKPNAVPLTVRPQGYFKMKEMTKGTGAQFVGMRCLGGR